MLLTLLSVLSIAPTAIPRIVPPPREATWAQGTFQCPAEVRVAVPAGWAEPALSDFPPAGPPTVDNWADGNYRGGNGYLIRGPRAARLRMVGGDGY